MRLARSLALGAGLVLLPGLPWSVALAAYLGNPAAGRLVLISTQVAAGSATLQWTGLGTTYNVYQLNCGGLVPATDAVGIQLQFGEGGTPTWETANYKWTVGWVQTDGTASATTPITSASDSGVNIIGTGSVHNTTVQSANTSVMIYNIPSATLTKTVIFSSSKYNTSGTVLAVFQGGGNYVGDANAITAMRVQATSGNLTIGTCSLYGVLP